MVRRFGMSNIVLITLEYEPVLLEKIEKTMNKNFEYSESMADKIDDKVAVSTINEINYVIVEISGRQFWVEPSKWYDVNRIPTEVDKEIILNRVLLASEKSGYVKIGIPYLDGVKVKAKILKHLRGPKTIVYKMRPKKKTRKKQGHRQNLTRILIDSINVTKS